MIQLIILGNMSFKSFDKGDMIGNGQTENEAARRLSCTNDFQGSSLALAVFDIGKASSVNEYSNAFSMLVDKHLSVLACRALAIIQRNALEYKNTRGGQQHQQ